MPNAPVVAVVLDQNLTKPLDYAVPEEWQEKVSVGMRVEVPFFSHFKKGTIVSLKEKSSIQNIKTIKALLEPKETLSSSLWKLAEWMAQYYVAPMQKVLRCFIPPSLRKGVVEKKESFVLLALSHEKTLEVIYDLRQKNPLHASILEHLLHTKKGIKRSLLMKELQIGESPIATLAKKKWIVLEKRSDEDLLEEDFFPTKEKTLNTEQKECLEKIVNSIKTDKFAAHLIQGVTGSGKTEIYLQAIKRALEEGKSAIMLVPEISLTSQTIERFRSRFQEKIAIWHHRRSFGQRNTAWEELREGKAQIVIGARSAIFCPIQNVGLIIVDEEHDSSYKQSDELPCYQARDVAVMRASYEKATIVLASATPSIESRYNADKGKYTLSKLTTRATAALLPKMVIVDMKEALKVTGGFTHFSPPLVDALKARLEAGEQSLLFLNKRGYHRLQVCASCKHTIKCPHCDVGLTYHKGVHLLRCHFCNHQENLSPTCPSCGSRETLQFQGFGTEHVQKSLHALFPSVRTLRMDKDTTKEKSSHEELYKQFRSHKADVLIGTQMIAKGFHFPSVTLVGVLNVDASLSVPDFRSAEQAFQLVTQVAGRAGRSQLPGEVILQTFLPEHPLFQLAKTQDYEAFYQRELAERKLFSYPPFSQIIKVSYAAREATLAEEKLQKFHTLVNTLLPEGHELLPVMPCGHPKLKDLYRFQFLIKTPKATVISILLKALPESTDYKVDVNPSSVFF